MGRGFCLLVINAVISTSDYTQVLLVTTNIEIREGAAIPSAVQCLFWFVRQWARRLVVLTCFLSIPNVIRWPFVGFNGTDL